jgi:hypothetical protein
MKTATRMMQRIRPMRGLTKSVEEFEITKLDIQRMQRYLDKCTYPSEVLHEDGGEDDGGGDAD